MPAILGRMWACADLDQIGVPGVLGNAEVVIAVFLCRHQPRHGELILVHSHLLRPFAKDVACMPLSTPSV